jgi:regulator of sirC expression with transglutaminase-like and TPR domain
MTTDLPEGSTWWLQEWAATVAVPSMIDRTRAAMLLSATASTHMRSSDDLSNELEQLTTLIDSALHQTSAIDDTFARWHSACFDILRLTGDETNYHDPRNSFLPDIRRRRTGLPIGLALFVLHAADRIAMPAYGVGMPGHFLVGAQQGAENRYIDVFHGGAVLDVEGARTLYNRVFSGRPSRPFDESALRPTPTPAMLIRMIANLKQHAARRRDFFTLADLARLRWFLPSLELDEARELVRLCVAVSSPTEAKHWFDAAQNRFGWAYPQDQAQQDLLIITAANN